MKIRSAVLLSFVTFASLASSSAASAQISNPVKFTIFGGAALPVGDTQDAVKTGYTVGGALDLRVPLSPLGFRGEIVYSGLDAKGLGGTGVDADVSDFGANLNLVAWFPTPTPVRPYFTAGPSFSRLKVSASTSGFSDSESENHWGFNFGAGLQFSLGELGTRLDARYRRISAGDGDDFSIIPITFGITF